jgi:hypothetical protein
VHITGTALSEKEPSKNIFGVEMFLRFRSFCWIQRAFEQLEQGWKFCWIQRAFEQLEQGVRLEALKEESALKRVTLYLVAELRSVSESDSSTEVWPATTGSLPSLNT